MSGKRVTHLPSPQHHHCQTLNSGQKTCLPKGSLRPSEGTHVQELLCKRTVLDLSPVLPLQMWPLALFIKQHWPLPESFAPHSHTAEMFSPSICIRQGLATTSSARKACPPACSGHLPLHPTYLLASPREGLRT